MTKSKETVARAFGQTLDRDDFAEFAQLLADDCIYEIGDQVLRTKESIAGLYEQNMLEGKKKFDELVWGQSRIESLNANEFEVYFSDYLKHRGIEHRYHCKQRIRINDALLVDQIVHFELPGERAALEAFYAKVGLV